jgi:membrane-associated protein
MAMTEFLDLFLHVDDKIAQLIELFGPWVYVVLFAIIFCETGLIVTPFLPGDSLLFALGVFAKRGSLDLTTLLVSLTIAAILGDSVNYWIGSMLGPRIFRGENVRFLNRRHLDKTHLFFERYGGKTIIIARFVPIVRTFAPFVAGMGRMTYSRFMAYNVIGAIVWVVGITVLGYWFADWPIVKERFELVIVGIIFVSILPAIVEFLLEWRRIQQAKLATPKTPDATSG